MAQSIRREGEKICWNVMPCTCVINRLKKHFVVSARIVPTQVCDVNKFRRYQNENRCKDARKDIGALEVAPSYDVSDYQVQQYPRPKICTDNRQYRKMHHIEQKQKDHQCPL